MDRLLQFPHGIQGRSPLYRRPAALWRTLRHALRRDAGAAIDRQSVGRRDGSVAASLEASLGPLRIDFLGRGRYFDVLGNTRGLGDRLTKFTQRPQVSGNRLANVLFGLLQSLSSGHAALQVGNIGSPVR